MISLAQKSHRENQANKIVNNIKNKLFSDQFCENTKNEKKHFIRNTKLNFVNLVITILNLGKASIQKELEKFFKRLGEVQKITAGALTHARKKLSPSAFISLNKVLVDTFYDSNNSESKKIIRRILGVDGSRIELPKNAAIIEEFGSAGNQEGAKPIGVASCLFDVELGITAKPLKVRLVKIFLDSGEIEVLVTSLLDDIAFPHSIFKDLYHLRWGIEEYYKTIKCVLEVESFCGKSVNAIYQEFYASIFMSNLQAIITVESDFQEKIAEISLRRKYNYQENRSSALYYLKDTLVVINNTIILLLQGINNLPFSTK